MKYCLLLLFFVFIGHVFSQPPTQQWLNRYNGDGDFSDKYNCVLTDQIGNIYLGGYTVTANQRKDYLLTKYESSGTLSWSVTFNGSDNKDDEILSMALGLNNQIVVTGYAKGNNTNDDIVTICYNQNGQLIWTAVYDNLLYSQDDQGNDIAVDALGNVIIAGQTDTDPSETSNDDYIILSYSPTGVQNWISFFDGTANSKDRALKVKIGNANSIYITGRSANLVDDDIVTRKYTSLGGLIWSQTYNNGMDDRPADMKLDASENVHICGFSNNGINDDILVLKYSSLGVDLWTGGFVFNGTSAQNEYASAMAVDANGNVYVTGKSDNDPNLTQNFDFKTLKINSSKILQWQADHNGSGNGEDEAYSLVLLPSGDVVITGKSDSDLNTTTSNFDTKTICYSASTGIQTWIKSFDGSAGKDDVGNQIAIDNSGNIYVAGSSQDILSESDALAIKYSSAGVENWSKLYSGMGDNTENVNAMTLDVAGNTYLAGYTYSRNNLKDLCIIKLNPLGDTLWVKKYNGTDNGNDEANDIKVDASGNVYITGFVKDSLTDFDFITMKLNASGNVLWTSQFNNNTVNGEDRASKLEIDPTGNVYVLGYADRNPIFLVNEDIVLIKYSSLGVQQWVKQYNGIGNAADTPFDLCYLPSGKIILTGSTNNTINDDIVTIAYNSSGTQLWLQTFAGIGGGKDKPEEMEFDFNENIYIAGRTSNGLNNDGILIKYNSSGTLLWSSIFDNNGWNEKGICLDISSAGTVYFSGITEDSLTGNVFIRSISSSGGINWTQIIDGGSQLRDEVSDLKIDNNGDIVLVGRSEINDPAGINWNFLTTKFSPSGTIYWNKSYDNNLGADDEINVCEIDVNNNIHVSGKSISISGQKDIVTIKYDSPLNTYELIEKSISVYPNPLSDFAQIDYYTNNSASISVRLIDIFGKEVRNEKLVDGKFYRNNLNSGIYILQVFNENNVIGVTRITVQE
jgi:uncharacterized delta-60 repeat protein